MSRYGIQVTEDQVKETILQDFGQYPRSGHQTKEYTRQATIEYDADEDNYFRQSSLGQSVNKPTEQLDLTQMLALLLIPSLLKAKVKMGECQTDNGSNGSATNLNFKNSHNALESSKEQYPEETNNFNSLKSWCGLASRAFDCWANYFIYKIHYETAQYLFLYNFFDIQAVHNNNNFYLFLMGLVV